MPLVYLDGPPYAGKTDLGTELGERWIDIMSRNPTAIPPTAEHIILELDQVHDPDAHREILNRYDPGNPQHLQTVEHSFAASCVYSTLYSPLYRKDRERDEYGELKKEGMEELDKLYTRAGGILVILLPNWETLQARAAESTDPDKPETVFLNTLIEKDIEAESHAESDLHADSLTERRLRQFVQISGMYGFFLRNYAEKYECYRAVGHPYHIPPESVVPPAGSLSWSTWPPMAFETKRRRIWDDILLKGIESQSAIMKNWILS